MFEGSELISPFPADPSLSSHNALNSDCVVCSWSVQNQEIGVAAKQPRNRETVWETFLSAENSQIQLASYLTREQSSLFSLSEKALKIKNFAVGHYLNACLEKPFPGYRRKKMRRMEDLQLSWQNLWIGLICQRQPLCRSASGGNYLGGCPWTTLLFIFV